MKKLFVILTLLPCVGFTQNLPELDKNVKHGILPNGLTYYIRKNTEPKERAELYLVNKFGSLQETDDQQGLAHFTEHMAFNGTRDFPKNTLIDYLQKAGVRFGADLNAYTSFDQTVYQLPIPTNDPELFNKGFDILLNWAGHISNEGSEIDAERGIILEEERARGKNVSDRIQQATFPVLTAHSRYNDRLPIGKTEILKTFKYKSLTAYYKTWYRPDLQAVIAVGDFDVDAVEKLIIQKFSSLKNPKKAKLPERYVVPDNDKPLVKIVTDPELPYTVFQLYYKHPLTVIKTDKQYRASLVSSLINTMLAERLEAVRQKPDAPYLGASAGYSGFIGNRNAFEFTVQSADAKGIERSIKAGITELQRMKQFGFTEGEIVRAKKGLLAGMERSYKERNKRKSAYFVNQYQQHFLTGEVSPGIEFEYDLCQKLVPSITLEEINKTASGFITDKNQVLILQGNDKDKAALPDEQTLLSWLNVESVDLEPYTETAVAESFMETLPKSGSIIAQKKLDNLGATELLLSNGVNVILKPTDFRDDEILITAFSKGGTSLADKDRFRTAQYAANIVGASGIASFSSTDMEKMLAGKNLYVSPYIGTYEEGIQAFSTPADLETAFQLIHLYFTAPRTDTTALNTIKKNLITNVTNRYTNPVAAFQDTLTSVLTSHNYRTKLITESEIRNLKSQDAVDFYSSRFSDADDFTFIITGNLPDLPAEASAKEGILRPLLETYIASLPVRTTSDNINNLNLRPLKGKIERKVYRGLEDKATVSITYHGLYDFSPENNIQLDALKEIINNKLTERLREKEGGVYSPSVSVQKEKIMPEQKESLHSAQKEKSPLSNYKLQVSFNCSAANTDKLIKATQEEIAAIRKNGVTQEDLVKFQTEEKRQLELRVRENSFWVSYIKAVCKGESSDTAYKTYPARLDALTPDHIKQAAIKFLKEDSVAIVVLLPEKK